MMPDSSIFLPSNYPNQLGFLSVTADEILDQLRSYSLRFIQVHNYEAERMIQFPPFIKAFYNCVFLLGRIPTQDEFYDFYLRVNREYFSSHHFSVSVLNGLQARIYRTYPSLVRDLYFNKLLEENNHGFEVVYNIDLDLERDIDTMLINNDTYWAACLYTQTQRGRIARKWKADRHIRFDNVSYIELPVTLSDERRVGEFFLYGRPEMFQLFDCINHSHHIIR